MDVITGEFAFDSVAVTLSIHGEYLGLRVNRQGDLIRNHGCCLDSIVEHRPRDLKCCREGKVRGVRILSDGLGVKQRNGVFVTAEADLQFLSGIIEFKRNCIPDGVKVGSVSLSPRADWRMPSDAAAALWLEEAQALTAEDEDEK